MAPGAVWLGVSMVQWRGGGASEMVGPAFDGSIGLTPRLQFSASVPRVAGGIGTSFFSAKIAVFDHHARGVKVAVAPTLEILNRAAMLFGPAGQGRTQWGLPISVELDRETARIYASSGYFSPGVWYAGAGMGKSLGNRVGVSISFSHAWAAQPAPTGAAASRRNDVSGGVSFDLTPTMAVFGSIGRTIATAAENGAGTTLSFGFAVNAGPVLLTE
jgi:hypothetical protein